ncbi:glycyl-tRNA synthetase beta chain [Bacillus ectoiniformans]|uniref:glycine--tRNA ligase subunit beta n=1 Tax=Bacillus ectoiniformans TaxID=1494429 RepID=UPI00195BAE12|nr:glycine--tRNA ligase subunit beta [Bacillus ectoiniformans]MBM7650007.1 glycyl-tRNA synthetase beta chain [Bacillus ectoiniformans]
MNKRDLLIEIGLEEMPARFVTESMNQLGRRVEEFLNELKITFGQVDVYSTPRRLAVMVKAVAEAQEDIEEEAKGPAKKIAKTEDGEWSKAAAGFARGQGMTVDDIFFKEIKGIEYAFVNKFIKGQATKDLLPKLEQVISSMTFGKNMRWASNEFRYVRPIKWMVALFGSEVIPFEITNVATGKTTLGHRFLGEQAEITEPAGYVETLSGQKVIADPNERKEMIRKQLKDIEAKENWVIPVDEGLLEEVNNLVEYPTALSGSFNEEFLELPDEVLITSMKEHQRYFPVKNQAGELLPYFVTVRNGDSHSLDKVAKGNEKVLRARLADADFFYKEDQKTAIAAFVKKLSTIVYHEKIGTLSEKISRIQRISSKLADMVGTDEKTKQQVNRAAEICKFDLVTHMVYEFPELQGVMGEKYAIQKGEDKEVAEAINQHYQPRHADDAAPEHITGALVSIADKLDTIISCFAVDIIPTGSQDPYALRRQTAGIVQTLIQHGWVLELEDILAAAVNIVKADEIGEKQPEVLLDELLSFFKLRIKYSMQEKEISHDVIDAVLEGAVGSLPSLFERAAVIMNHKNDAEFKSDMEALSRVLNIAKKADKNTEVNTELFANEQENVLFNEYIRIQEALKSAESIEDRYQLLVSVKPAIDDYFEHTMIMSDDENIKTNRLSQMSKLANLILDFAHFNSILVK